MTITYNGDPTELPDGTGLNSFLESNEYRPEMIAVEINLEIIPKEKYAQTVLHDGDILEVVSFMGGG